VTPAADIIVTGIKASLRTAQSIKRNSSQIVDSIVADDIGKLPDVNVAEALQRVTGVQITRNQGAGSGIAIRGLTQVLTEVNGRSIFTAGSGRTFSLEDVPSELLAGADVYKSPSAKEIEGGTGGLINLRLRQPFDFDGLQISGQVRANYYDLANKAYPAASALVSDRWDTEVGPMGLLVSASYQKEGFETDLSAGGSTTTRNDVYDFNRNGFVGTGATAEPGDTIQFPVGGGLAKENGTRRRIGANLAYQWQPSPEIKVHVDGLYNNYKFLSNYILLFGTPNGATTQFQPGSFQFYNGTNNVSRATFLNSPIDSNAFTSNRQSTTWQTASGLTWDHDKFHLSSDLSYTRATTHNTFLQVAYQAMAPTLTVDASTAVPSLLFGGIDLSNPANFTFNRVSQSAESDIGSELAGRLDGTFDVDNEFINKLEFGVRYANRKANIGSNYTNLDLSGQSIPVSSYPALLRQYNLGLFPGQGYSGTLLSDSFVAPNYLTLANFDSIRSHFGLPLGDPAPSPSSTYALAEKTWAGYVQADYKFEIGLVKISGNAGVRVIHTSTSTNGVQTQMDGSYAPLAVSSNYTSVLPAFNFKADLTKHLAIRGAFSKTLTRPDFSQLSPSMSLDFLFKTGGAGNPALGPLKSTNFDLTAEYYLSSTSSLFVDGFIKNVDGFITSVASQETVPGQSGTFLITRPVNGDAGKIRGMEVGWNQFLDFLPAPFDGLGFQANYTYVYSQGPSPVAGFTLPLLGLSKNSYNLVGLYEKGPLSIRIAYNWRDKYVNSLQSGGVIAPNYQDAVGYLDSSINFDIGKHVTVFLDGSNLLRTTVRQFFSTQQNPLNVFINDRRISGGVRFRL
jgi:TonB-dependent receptor